MINNQTSILFAGDYHTYGPFDKFIMQNPNHNVFSEELVKLVSDCDLSVFNLEDPITKSTKGCIKSGPFGVGSEESLIPIKRAGFQLATFATNHTYDMKNRGIEDTINYCNKHKIDITGAGLNLEQARRVYHKTIKKHKIAILNFSRTEFNIATDSQGGANPLDVIDNSIDIKHAKKNADLVFAVIHEGLDVFPLPYPKLVKQMRFYADMGADAIILHHSRIISGYEVYNSTPIFYGIGNLLHLSQNTQEHNGLIVRFNIDKAKNIAFEFFPIELDPDTKVVSFSKSEKKEEIIRNTEKLSEIIIDDNKLQTEWNNYVQNKSTLYLSILAGYPRILYRISKKLKILNLYKKYLLINKRKYLPKKNIIQCQAHYEAVNHILSYIFKEKNK